MTNYFKVNNHCKFCGKTFIVTIAIMSDIRAMLYFTLEVFCCLANQNHGHICVMLE